MVLFSEMGLDGPVLKAIEDLGFTEPTPIQEKVIPKILKEKKDIIAQAQTGTGKTAAFGLPLVQMMDMTDDDVQCLVLCPTRELCIQITGDLQSFSTHVKGFRVIPVYGGASMDTQIRSLKKGGQIVVGTPGRILDLFKRKVLKIKKIKWLVLDEADEMLNMGFKEDLDEILGGTPSEKQTMLFSATMPKEILRISNEYMHSPDQISAGTKNAGADNVIHQYYVTHAKYRYEVLKRIADMNPNIYGIVFCRTRMETKEVAEKFMNDGYNADALHGDLSQAQRDYVMNRFRNRSLQMLVATDVAARGLDVNDLTHVINYNLPDELEIYIHRSGRTGRAGRSGISITIIHTREGRKIQDLERIAKKPFERKMIPGGKEICKKQLFNLIDRVEKVELNEEEIGEFLPEISKKLEWLSREELIKHFVSVEFNRFLSYYKNAPDLNVDFGSKGSERYSRGSERSNQGSDRYGKGSDRYSKGSDRNSRGPERISRGSDRNGRGPERISKGSDRNSRGPERISRGTERNSREPEKYSRDTEKYNRPAEKNKGERKSQKGYTRFFINLGEKNELNAARLMGLVNEQTRTRNIEVGKIDILRKFSFFEIDSQYESEVLKAFKNNCDFDGTSVSVEISKPEDPGKPRESVQEFRGPKKKGYKKKSHQRK